MRAYVIALWISLLFLSGCSWISSTYIKNNGDEVVTIKLFFDSSYFSEHPTYLVQKELYDGKTDHFALVLDDSWPTCNFNQSLPTAFEDDEKTGFATDYDMTRLNMGTCVCVNTAFNTMEFNLMPGDSIHLGSGDHVGLATSGIDSIHMLSNSGSMKLNGNRFVQSAFQHQRNNNQILFTAPTHPYVVRRQETENI